MTGSATNEWTVENATPRIGTLFNIAPNKNRSLSLKSETAGSKPETTKKSVMPEVIPDEKDDFNTEATKRREKKMIDRKNRIK